MSDNPAADDATSTTDDEAPNAKKAKVDALGSSCPSLPATGDVDGPRKGTLTLTIDDWEAFKGSTETLYSEPLMLAGIEWKTAASVKERSVVVALQATNPMDPPCWVRKVEFVLRWPGRPQEEYDPKTVLYFRQGSSAVGVWSRTNSFEHVERTGVNDNELEFVMDFTTFHCYITEGAFGIPSRFHDVTFVVGNRRMYSNKGFLAANAGFFEAMFFGDFADKNKDEVTLDDINYVHFCLFLCTMAPGAPPITRNQVLYLLRMADRFQAHSLVERCIEYLLKEQPANISFVQQLEIADELNMGRFRDLLIDYASTKKLAEAAAAENEEKFTRKTWMKLFLKYKQFKPTE